MSSGCKSLLICLLTVAALCAATLAAASLKVMERAMGERAIARLLVLRGSFDAGRGKTVCVALDLHGRQTARNDR